jgi:hypothetical protein
MTATPSDAAPWRLAALAMVALTLLAQGCREEEQDRPLVHQKGSYEGPADQKLDQEQIEALRQRASQQHM